MTFSFLPSVSALAVCTMGISARTLVLIQEEAGRRMVAPHHLLHWAADLETVVGGAGLWEKDQKFCLGCVIRHTRFRVSIRCLRGGLEWAHGPWSLDF